uniref:KIB1-4 beta-propeller domain-containing protein n=1 Tax=Tanacetum cinerariifolium TaxID=118510 RepID=A0A699IML9_TANCI|nr:hypothetical protein [Tanacetum cinerariifolium]
MFNHHSRKPAMDADKKETVTPVNPTVNQEEKETAVSKKSEKKDGLLVCPVIRDCYNKRKVLDIVVLLHHSQDPGSIKNYGSSINQKVDEDHASQLINPLSHETINLPNVDTILSLIYATWKETTMLVDVSTMPRNLYHEAKVRVAYLIGLDDGERKRLLVIIKEGKVLDKHIRTKRFLVSIYDLKNEKWSEVKDLGTKALFVGDASFWIEEDTIKVIQFRDDGYISHGSWANGKAKDMGIYHLSDETIKPYIDGGKLCRVTPLIWLQSI